ncbi:DUF4124 domain-containing protein [Marinobacter sp.]|uniref:DUF4124 domain-containing protein n=1 Tax=Marinobacter sp. TaxID=50741 RepID=UPI003A9390D0
MLKGMLFVIAITAPAISYGAVYQCKANGQTVFSDSPCGDDAKKLDHKPAPAIGGQFDTGTDVEFYEPPASRVDGRIGRRLAEWPEPATFMLATVPERPLELRVT